MHIVGYQDGEDKRNRLPAVSALVQSWKANHGEVPYEVNDLPDQNGAKVVGIRALTTH